MDTDSDFSDDINLEDGYIESTDLIEDIFSNVISEIFDNYLPIDETEILTHEDMHRVFSLGLQFISSIRDDNLTCVVDDYYITRPKKSSVVSWSPSLIVSQESLVNPPFLVERIDFKGRIRIPNTLLRVLEECLHNPSEVVVIPFSVWVYTLDGDIVNENTRVFGVPTNRFKLEGHQVLVLVNKASQQIEFYDPNGADAHYEWYKNHDYEKMVEFLVSSFPELSFYDMFGYEDTCPSFGIQRFDEGEGVFGPFIKGYCKFWSLLNLHIRLLYPEENPFDLQTTLLRLFTERGRGFSRDFILRYITFLLENIQDI